jgi:ATP-dependent DNA ligase
MPMEVIDREHMMEILEDTCSIGYEGLVVRENRTTRGTGWKLKQRFTADLPVTYIDPSSQSVTVDVNGVECSVKVSTQNKQKLKIGDMIEIEYFCRTDSGSLRNPVFKRIREPKRTSIA